jgi:ubiquinone/menaquinone biosynthesis C-methylase UbiE
LRFNLKYWRVSEGARMSSESVSFDRAVEYYDQTRGFPPGVDAEAARLFVQAGHLTKTSRILEIGVGTGRIALPLAQHVGAYFGIDLSAGMLAKLHEKRAGEPIYVTQGDATRLPYAAQTFDAAVAVHVFHLIPGWRDTLRELARVLKADGLLLHGGGQRVTENRFDEVWQAGSGRKWNRQGQTPAGETKQFLENAGWQPVGSDFVHRYSTQRSPQQYLDAIRNRIWSHCWSMTEAQIEAGYQALLAYVSEHFPDPTTPLTVEQSFRVRAYRPI